MPVRAGILPVDAGVGLGFYDGILMGCYTTLAAWCAALPGCYITLAGWCAALTGYGTTLTG